MNFHAEPVDITSNGNAISDLAEQLREGTRRGRSLALAHPGLAATAAFESLRDSWLGQGERISTDLDDTGNVTVDSSRSHMSNEDLIERGYTAVNPR